MSRKLKINDRVSFTKTNKILGYKKGEKATLMTVDHPDGSGIVNTDKLNNYNHNDWGGNGLLVLLSSIELLSRRGGWTKKEVNYLHKYYRRKSVADIANHLSRTYYSVQSKAMAEGIHKHPRREYNKFENHVIIHAHVDNIPLEETATNLHRSLASISSRIVLMNNRQMLPQLKEKKC